MGRQQISRGHGLALIRAPCCLWKNGAQKLAFAAATKTGRYSVARTSSPVRSCFRFWRTSSATLAAADPHGGSRRCQPLSPDAKVYLLASGLGGIIGDGQFPEARPEQIIEPYFIGLSFAKVTGRRTHDQPG